MKTRIAAIIPARMASTRFPNKPLLEIEGLPMIEHVRRRALLCKGFAEVVVATCDEAIAFAVKRFDGKVVMTSDKHCIATERIVEAAQHLDCTHVVNVQGDEILLVPSDLEKMLGDIMSNPKGPVWNAIAPLTTKESLRDSSMVKCVVSQTDHLLFCSRNFSTLPFKGDTFDLLYGGGVIEHFKDTVGVVGENYRVLKKGGVAFNSVPKFNLGSLTYRQMWGNIPSAPVLRQIAEFVHIKILKGKRMIYGYEYSFTDSQLRKIFAKAGFRREKVDVGRYEVPLLLEYIKNKIARKVALVVAKSDLFWPATYILSRK